MTAQPLRAAVVGTGYLGRFHALKYAALEGFDLIGVVDTDRRRAHEVAQEVRAEPVTDYRALAGQVDAVSIAVPTQLHHEVSSFFLDHGIHVLLEKPIAVSVAQANDLVVRAAAHDVVLQIGHLERFNPAVMALGEILDRPMFIESHRLAPYSPRGTDVSVILDLMIHDIDIIQDLVKSPVKEVSPIGVPVMNAEIDIANARIAFENGSVANVTASRVSTRTERKMRVFQHNAYIVVDFLEKTLATYQCRPGMSADPRSIQGDLATFEQTDALMAEIESFRTSIQSGKSPLVSGEDGARALETAMLIAQQMRIPTEIGQRVQ